MMPNQIFGVIFALMLTGLPVLVESRENKTEPFEHSFLINPQHFTCNSKPIITDSKTQLLLVALVTIPADNFRARISIRHTWSNFNLFNGMRIVFITGKSTSEIVNLNLKAESDLYGDVIQGDFDDRNMTTKTIMGLKWIAEYCTNADYVLKIDETNVVNTHFLLSYLRNIKKEDAHDTIMCRVIENQKVVRDELSKYYVSRDEFEPDVFPTYCNSRAYIMTGDMVPKLVNESSHVPAFRYEDVYVGMLVENMNASLANITSKYVEYDIGSFGMKLFDRKIDTFFFIGVKNLYEFDLAWNYVYANFIDYITNVFLFI